MKLSFFGDYFSQNDVILDTRLMDSDLTFINLEGPITSTSEAIFKAGPNIKGSKVNLERLVSQFNGKKIFFNLANNHIGDFGEIGIIDTIKCLGTLKNVYYAGCSKNNEIIPVVIDDLGIAIISMCERQFGVSQINKVGVSYFSSDIYREISRLKDRNYKVIISTHSAEEMIPWVAPRIRCFFKSLIDAGADIVYNTHTHIPAGYEYYNGGIIMYGLGNFICDSKKWSKYKNATTSLMISVSGVNLSYDWITSNGNYITISNGLEDYIAHCNRPFGDEVLYESVWQEYSVRKYFQMYRRWLRPNLVSIGKRIIKAFLLRDFRYFKRTDSLLNYHLWACESHRQTIECALGILSGEIKDLRTDLSKSLVDEFYQ